MYSDKENVNILTSLLVKRGVKCAVVCPGSRNAPIVHNLNACAEIDCYPVTDERSAGFFALGLSQIEDEPVVVCVTSGSALLNVAPAVAEAYYQHRKLIVISADRPASMIGQLQGQTLVQPGALDHYVRRSVSLPEPHDDTEHWYCNRLVNEALIEMKRGEGGPVHINVPISEPLFGFTVKSLPDERVVELHEAEPDFNGLSRLSRDFKKAKRPMILIGQSKLDDLDACGNPMMDLMRYAVVLSEKTGNDMMSPSCYIDEVLIEIEGDEDKYMPDFIVYMGGAFVSKRIRQFLQKARGVRTVVVNRDGALHDVFMNATDVFQATMTETLSALAIEVYNKAPTAYLRKWNALLEKCMAHETAYIPAFSQMTAVRYLFEVTGSTECEYQFANSMAVRLGLIYSPVYIHVNRGVNGIEGCLSTAVGFASGIEQMVVCVIGDLSFFYDQNALWNNNLTNNLRILLLNNGGGGIFRGLSGLKESPASEILVAGAHQTNAEGICEQNNVHYLSAHNMEELEKGMDVLADPNSMFPVLLEVFTDSEEDERVFREYLYGNKKQMN